MPAKRLSIRPLRKLLSLCHSAGLCQATIAASLGLFQLSASNYFRLAGQAGLSCPLPADFDDDDRLEARLSLSISSRI